MVMIHNSAQSYSQYWGKKWSESQLFAVMKDLDFPKECNGILAGGSVCRHLLGTDIFKSDIDIFPVTEDAKKAIIKHLEAKLPGSRTSKYSHNYTYKMGVRETKIQVITKEPPAPATSILDRFDIEHCKQGIVINVEPEHATMIYTDIGAIALAKRAIILANVTNASYTMARVLKYKEQLGFEADHAIKQLTGAMIKSGTVIKQDFSMFSAGDALDEFDNELDTLLKMGSS